MEHWFLDSEFSNCDKETARFHVIPFPLEDTVSTWEEQRRALWRS